MSTIAETPTTQKPARPLFVVCPGVPVLDQDRNDQLPVRIKAPPVSDDEDHSARSEVDSNCDDVSSERSYDEDDESDINDDLYLGEMNYHSLPNEINDCSSSSRVNRDAVPNGVTSGIATVDVKEDQIVNTEKTVLVPVRDPVTREIKNVLVPIEVKDDTGLNIIKSVLIPIQDEDGSISYEVKKVIVPIKLELCLPQQKAKPSPGKSKSKQINDKRGEDKRLEEKEVEKEKEKGENAGDEKKEEGKNEEDLEKVLEPDPPKEEVDQILDKLRNICPFCQKGFIDEKEMDRHVRRNHKKPYRCGHCHLAYVWKEAFEDHLKVHKKDSYAECPFCHQRYKSMSGLRNHQIRVHSTIDPKFICDHCDKRFKLKCDLAVHIDRTHMNITHICRFCGKAVKNIMVHEYQHQKVAKKANYQFCCHLCPKKFQVRNRLENHLVMHKNGFKCDQCKEVFSRPSALKTHKDVKHGPSMLCTICEKRFNYRGSFYHHVVVAHAGIRPYKCDICGEDFTQRHCLVKHRKIHPGPLPPLNNKTQIADIAKKILQKP